MLLVIIDPMLDGARVTVREVSDLADVEIQVVQNNEC